VPYIRQTILQIPPKKLFLSLMKNLEISQRDAQRMIDSGRVSKDGAIISDKSIIIEGEYEAVVFVPESVDIEVVYENEHFAVLNKPSGLLVHPKGRNSPISLLDAIKSRYGKEANITHRLDKETSGLVLCAKNRAVEIELKRKFEERAVQKTYHALVFGDVQESGAVDAPLLEPSRERKSKISIVDVNGKESLTIYEPIARYGDRTLLKVTPKTGRTHQIRAHLAHIGYPIAGDLLYISGEEVYKKYLDELISEREKCELSGGERLMLHASLLEFRFQGEEYKIQEDAEFRASLEV